jgi:hypothetical protein
MGTDLIVLEPPKKCHIVIVSGDFACVDAGQ